MLLDILQSTEHPSQQGIIWPEMSVVLRLRNQAYSDDSSTHGAPLCTTADLWAAQLTAAIAVAL